MSKSAAASSAPAAARDSTWNVTPVQRRRTPGGDPAQGYFQSSQDLRAGLEISWQPLASLPADLAAAFVAALMQPQRSSSSAAG